MKKLVLALGIVLAVGTCKSQKQRDRETTCATAQMVFEKGWHQQLEGMTLPPDKKALADNMLKNAQKNFHGYCMGLSDHDMDCIENFQTKQNDPDCSHIQKDVMSRLFGM
jgi:hypothetical protein